MENDLEYLFAFAALALFYVLVYTERYFQKKGKDNRTVKISFNIVGPLLVLLFLTYMAVTNKNYVYGVVAAFIFISSIDRFVKWRKKGD